MSDENHETPKHNGDKPTAREKTVSHLKGLIAAAAGATLAASSCCSGTQNDDPVVCDPLPPPVEADAGPDEGTQGQQGQGEEQGQGEGGVAITDAGPTPPPEIVEPPPVVCDPLPPPMEDE